jgi:hypothetical protein
MGSPEMGAIHYAQGENAQLHAHPLEALEKKGLGALEMGTIPSSFIAPEAGGTGTEVRTLLGIPNVGHATRVMGQIEKEAANIPVMMGETKPALGEWSNYLQTGGKPSRPLSLLSRRVTPVTKSAMAAAEDKGPVLYPEARDFYTNVSRSSAKPGFLRRAIESPEMPQQRMEIGKVRGALQNDIKSAADQVGRGNDLAKAMKEYGRAQDINKFLRRGAIIGGGEIARRAGAGDLIRKVTQ